jgi:hypothetical protein
MAQDLRGYGPSITSSRNTLVATGHLGGGCGDRGPARGPLVGGVLVAALADTRPCLGKLC